MALARRDFDPGEFNPNSADFLPLIDKLTMLAMVGIVDPAAPRGQGGDRRGARPRECRCA